MNKFFKIKEHDSSVRVEIMAGLTTFFAMCYILLVNPKMVTGTESGKLYNGVFIATALSAFIGTLLYALLARQPYAQASGMGLNFFFFISFIGFELLAPDKEADMIVHYQRGLAIIFVSGVIFMILSMSGIRKAIVESLPTSLKKAIPAGIGLFIAHIGLQNIGVITKNPGTGVSLGSFKVVGVPNAWYEVVAPVLAAAIGLFIIFILAHLKIKGAIIIGILFSTIFYYLLNIGNAVLFESLRGNPIKITQAFKDFGEVSFGKGLSVGFKNFFGFGDITAGVVFETIMILVTFILVDMFDTLGTLQATATEANLLDENGNPIGLGKALYCDSIATVAGSILGTSTVTTFVESSAGIAAGGRTGLTSLVASLCFLISMFFVPLTKYIPTAATAPVLVFVGVLMLKNFSDIDLKNIRSAVPACLTVMIMPLAYSISDGIAFGMISYTILTILTGKFKKKDIVVTILSILFIVKYLTI